MPSFIRHFNSIRTGQLVVIIIPMELLQPSRYAGYLMNYLCSSPFFSSPALHSHQVPKRCLIDGPSFLLGHRLAYE